MLAYCLLIPHNNSVILGRGYVGVVNMDRRSTKISCQKNSMTFICPITFICPKTK